MRNWNLGRTFAVLLMGGFLIGIVYVNLFAKSYIMSMNMFSDMFFEQFSGMEINIDEYLFYIIKMRVVPIGVLLILGCTGYKKATAFICLLWTGFSFGTVITTAILKMNIKGVFLCLFAMCPHFICYIAAYTMLIIYYLEYPGIRWNHSKTVSFILFVLVGIILECYMNPVLMNMLIRML